jgi:hypothetical protein
MLRWFLRGHSLALVMSEWLVGFGDGWHTQDTGTMSGFKVVALPALWVGTMAGARFRFQ